jgi:hypothetical protein
MATEHIHDTLKDSEDVADLAACRLRHSQYYPRHGWRVFNGTAVVEKAWA